MPFSAHLISRHYTSLQEAFLAVDTHRSGTVDVEELVHVLMNANVCFPKQDIESFVRAHVHNTTGEFRFSEFCSMLDGTHTLKRRRKPITDKATQRLQSKTTEFVKSKIDPRVVVTHSAPKAEAFPLLN